MKVIEQSYVCLLADVANLTGLRELRGSYEGLQWCLNEAPKLEKYLLSCLESGVNPDFERFPKWLERLARGSLTDPLLMRYLRQLLLFCYKAYVQHDNHTTLSSLQSFDRTNVETGIFGNSLATCSPILLDLVRKHCQSVLYCFNEKAIKPSHGPGASTTPKEKWTHWYQTIDYCYPYTSYMSLYANRDHMEQFEDCQWPSHIEARMTAVPKDSRGPRLICVHPAESIWIQQGVRRELERAIRSRRRSYGQWPCGHIHFDDQRVNGRIALLSSKSGRYATLDMKEASDRISETLVQYLFGRKYKWFGCCRAQKYSCDHKGFFPSDNNIYSYAPMGNATTFPVQSLVFWAICCASLQYHGYHQPGAVFVFGDDIEVPAVMAPVVINDLESFGLVVNRTKSFWRSAFRESCGVDAFNGVNVTPIRWKASLMAESLFDLQSLSDMAMRLRLASYHETAATVYRHIERTMRRRYKKRLFLTNNLNHGGIAEFCPDYRVWRDSVWSHSRHWYGTPIWRLKTLDGIPSSHDWNHVLESVCSLERTGRSSIPDRLALRRVRLNREWVSIS